MAEQGKRVSVRWSEQRIAYLKELGWLKLPDKEILNKALEAAIREKD